MRMDFGETKTQTSSLARRPWSFPTEGSTARTYGEQVRFRKENQKERNRAYPGIWQLMMKKGGTPLTMRLIGSANAGSSIKRATWSTWVEMGVVSNDKHKKIT